METLGKIRRRHKLNGESISAIASDFKLSRNTVRKFTPHATLTSLAKYTS